MQTPKHFHCYIIKWLLLYWSDTLLQNTSFSSYEIDPNNNI